MNATLYQLDRLRCNLCEEVFTAPEPMDVGDEKYDETAASMIGLLKYGAGLPFHRIEKQQLGPGIPLPAATQWEIVEQAAGLLGPAHAEFIDQAAQGEVLHNDDTTATILELSSASSEQEPGFNEDAMRNTARPRNGAACSLSPSSPSARTTW